MCLLCGVPKCDGVRCSRARSAEANRSLARLVDNIAEHIRYETLTAPPGSQAVVDEIKALYEEAKGYCDLGDASAGWRALKRARRLELGLKSVEELIPLLRAERIRARTEIDDERAEAAAAILDPVLKAVEARSWPAGEIIAALGPALSRALPTDEAREARERLAGALGGGAPSKPDAKELAATLAAAMELRDAHNDEQHATRDDISRRLTELAFVMGGLLVALLGGLAYWPCMARGSSALPYLVLMGAVAGALGAGTSASQRLVQGEGLPTMFTSRVVTRLRPLIGSIAGAVAVLGAELVAIGLGVDQAVQRDGSTIINTAAVLSLAFAAGFSERIVISALEQKS